MTCHKWRNRLGGWAKSSDRPRDSTCKVIVDSYKNAPVTVGNGLPRYFHPTFTGTSVMVSLPNMSITLTATV